MADTGILTAADVRLMQRLAQRVTALRPDLVNSDAAYGELAWNWGRGHATAGPHWRRRLWWDRGEPVAWGWAALPRRVTLNDGSVRDVTGAHLTYQVHPGHSALVDEVIDWYDTLAAGLERTVVPTEDAFALERWSAHGYADDPDALGDTGSWTQLNVRDLDDGLERPELPDGHRFLTADETTPETVVRAHVAAWGPSAYDLAAYEGVRRTAPYRGDLHVLVVAPDGTPAASALMWLDEANATAEFEPVGTHPEHRRRGLGRALLLHGMHRARAAGARQMTVASLGAPGHRAARGLYYSVGFRRFTRDVPLLRPATP
ncbi:GNAT family N-acetyltransferase [Streptomyces sp. SID5785]|uniref:GNAT family N-acetyltransferase n=1 Tax=Streptomyces sp. SID5785 TaxID=2690309 RepID=UPI00136116D1|nr:GNAT family N-acetyltransferase [Streptomyces sp. SID5785]MZD08348.1 GNAT family N-acetyltransferase [Streptomyces sp. SID5785]